MRRPCRICGIASGASTLFPGYVWLPRGFIGCRKFWQSFFEFFRGSCWESNLSEGWNVATRYRCASKVTIVLLFRVQQYGAEESRIPSRWCCAYENPEGSAYYFSRTALNVPCFEGPSPTSGEKSTSPAIKSGVSNFPLNVKVPASRPTLPIRNSTGPENVTELASP
jgi:hypothetical protein